MSKINRREFNGILGAAACSLAMPEISLASQPKVVVIGGGAGGATAARHLAKRLWIVQFGTQATRCQGHTSRK